MAKKKSEEYDKIMQLLTSRDEQNVQLGLQLLKGTMDPQVLVEFLTTGSYLSYMICYPLVPFFQKQPELWKKVAAKTPGHIKSGITRFLPHKILHLDNHVIPAFCELANKEVQVFYPDFPELTPAILTEREGYYVGETLEGSEVVDGIGWSMKVDRRDIGPAEVIHEEEWHAAAHHPDLTIHIYREEKSYFPKVWLVKGDPK